MEIKSDVLYLEVKAKNQQFYHTNLFTHCPFSPERVRVTIRVRPPTVEEAAANEEAVMDIDPVRGTVILHRYLPHPSHSSFLACMNITRPACVHVCMV